LFSGSTNSGIFPITNGAFQQMYGGGYKDIFISKISNNGSNLIFSTFLGGNSFDTISKVELTISDEILVSGMTYSFDFPSTIGVYQPLHSGGLDVFISKLSNNGSNLIFSTFLGGTNDDYSYTMNVLPNGNLILPGFTHSLGFPITLNSFQQLFGGGSNDVFVSLISNDGTNLFYSTFLGGSDNDYSLENKVKLIGCNLYMSPTVHSIDFPVTTGVYQTIKTHIDDTPVVLKMSLCDEDYVDLRDTSNCFAQNIPFSCSLRRRYLVRW
jgi:hypothetical protein